MALETATYIASLVTTNPDGTDQRTTADDHIRLIKATLKRTFPLLDGAVSLSSVQYAYLNDVSRSVQSQLNQLRDGSATANAAVNARYANSASYAATAAALNGVAASDFARLSQGVTFTGGTVRVQSGSGSTTGAVNVASGGSATFPGYVEFIAPGGGRVGYIGSGDGSGRLYLFAQSPYVGWRVSGTLDVNGQTVLTTSSLLNAANLSGSVPNASVPLSAVQQHQSSLSVASATNATTATTAANATAVGGFAASVAAAASTVAARDSSGNLFAVYVNQSSAAETGAVTHLMTKQGDNYVRAATPAHAGQYISGQNISGRTGTTKTLSTSAPSGGSNGDIWYRYA